MDIDDHAVRPPDRVRRRPCTARCCLITMGLIGTLIFGVFLWFTVPWAWKLFQYSPHSNIMLDLDSTSNKIYPLIGPDSRFDVAFTVWVRKSNSDTAHPERYLAEWDGGDQANNSDAIHIALYGPTTLADALYLPEEVAVFSDIILEDFSLASKHREVTVDFKLPLKRLFSDRLININDVRAALSLVPRNPSFLEHVANVTTVLPDGIAMLPNLDPALNVDGRLGEPGSVKRLALERLATSVPLLRFSEEFRDAGNVTTDSEEEEEGEEKDNGSGDVESAGPKGQLHPFLRTRSHFYFVNETRPLSADMYKKYVSAMKRDTCVHKHFGKRVASRFFCDTSETYRSIGHFGAMFDLDKGDGEDISLAYGPYLGTTPHGHYKNMRLPDDQDEVDVKFTVMLSSYKPWRLALIDSVTLDQYPDAHLHNATEVELQASEDAWRLMHGIVVAPVEGTKAWTRLVLATIHWIISFMGLGLIVIYWYTRQTITGISQKGTLIAAMGSVMIAGAELVWEDVDFWYFVVISGLLGNGVALLQIRAVQPFTLAREGSKWTIRRWRWTHRERATRRLDPSWLYALGVFLMTLSVFLICGKYELGLKPPSIDTASDTTPRPLYYAITAFAATEATAMILQAIVNARSGTFAGSYALGVACQAGIMFIDLLYQTPAVGQRFDSDGLALRHAIEMVIAFVLVYQAATLPRVEQVIPDEDE